MGVDDIIKQISTLSEDERKRILSELRSLLRKRKKTKIPEEARAMLIELSSLKERVKEIRSKLKEMGIKAYDYRGSPLYNTVKSIVAEHRIITVDGLAEELKRRGYSFSGATGTVLRSLREDGYIVKEGDRILWQGKE